VSLTVDSIVLLISQLACSSQVLNTVIRVNVHHAVLTWLGRKGGEGRAVETAV